MNPAVQAWSARGRAFSAGGVASHVWQEGDGEPVICLHGVPASAFIYRRLMPELAARGVQGVAFDLPGLGLAERPPGFDYTWSGLSAWVAAAIDALEIDCFHLVVHDIGGPVGFDVVRGLSGRVKSLLALNTWVRVTSFKRPWVMEPFAHRGIGELWLASMSGPAFVLLMRRIGVRGPVPAQELRAYVELLKRGDRGRAFLRIMRSFERTPEFERRILAALGEVPAQVAWGVDDPAVPLDRYGEEVRDALGAETIHRLPGRHFVMEDSPAEIAELVVSGARRA